MIIETSSSYGRDILAGIVRYMRTHEHWSVFLEQSALDTKPPDWLSRWSGDGIISRVTTRKLVEAISATGVPFVDLTDRHGDFGYPRVWSDDETIGRLGAEHLLERGFQQFGFCGFTREAWSMRRQQAFQEATEEAGCACEMYVSPWQKLHTRPWGEEQRRLIGWVRSLPKPVGIMACNDVRGQHVLDACALAGIRVPEEAAVIGVDNDELLAQLCNPPLSSVIPNSERVGYEAAELLSQLMSRRKPKPRERLIAPLGVATRLSTDVVAIDDPIVASAVHYIRSNACFGITVGDVVRQLPVSRSSLERRFRKYLKRSPQQEIRNVQLRRARQLLAETDLPLQDIAEACGFQHPEYLHVVFKRELGQTPGAYRHAAQP